MRNDSGIVQHRCAPRTNRAFGTSGPVVQALEDRRLFSVSAALLVGPVGTGDSFTYKHVKTGGILEITDFQETVIVGPTRFADQDVIERNDFTSDLNPVPRTAPLKNYNAFDSTGRFIHYGSINTDANSNTETTITVAAGNPLFPAQLDAGTTYTFDWAPDVVTIGGVTLPASDVERRYSVTLASESLEPVTVPAGTFQAYEFSSTTVITFGATNTILSSTAQQWFAPDVGLIKSIGTVAGDTEVDTLELLSYDVAGSPPPGSTGSAATRLKIAADLVAIDDAKANRKSVLAANKSAAATEKAADQAAIAAIKAQRKLHKGDPTALANDKALLSAAVGSLKSHTAAAKAKAKADNASAVAEIKAATAELKADKRQLALDLKAGL